MEKYCGLINSIYCIARKIINLVLLQEKSPTVPSCLVQGHYIKRLLIHAGWQWGQVGLTSLNSRVQNWGDPLKGRGNQGHTRSKATREKQRNQAESQAVPGPGVVGWRRVMKSPSLYSGVRLRRPLFLLAFSALPLWGRLDWGLPVMWVSISALLCFLFLICRHLLLYLRLICSRVIMVQFVFCF